MTDNTKWSEIYKKHSQKMLWVCKRYVNDIALAEDLMHEGFITAMQKQNTFSGFGSFEGWLRTIMVNTSLMHLRKSKSSLFISDIDISDTTTPITDMNATYNTKSKIINTDFTQQELIEVVEAIPEHHKMVFNMFVIDKFSHDEIGKILNITTNTSKSHLLRARKKIQELLLLKANEKEQKLDRRKLFFWFLFSSSYIDSLYANGFASFHETPSQTFNIDEVIRQQNLPLKITSGHIFGITLQKVFIAAASIALVSSAFLYFQNKENKSQVNQTIPNEAITSDEEATTNPISINQLQRDTLSTPKNDALNSEKQSIEDSEKSASSKTESSTGIKPKKPDKKSQARRSVVIKKIIDTVYVYK